MAQTSRDNERGWTFLTNHSHVFISIAKEPDILLREVAARVGITERAVQRIVADLEQAGYLRKVRSGRRNRYELRLDLPLRHPMERSFSVGALLGALLEEDAPARPRGPRRAAPPPARKRAR